MVGNISVKSGIWYLIQGSQRPETVAFWPFMMLISDYSVENLLSVLSL